MLKVCHSGNLFPIHLLRSEIGKLFRNTQAGSLLPAQSFGITVSRACAVQ